MNRERIQSLFAVLVIITGLVTLPAMTVSADVPDNQRSSLARFALASGEPARALYWLEHGNQSTDALSDQARLLLGKAWLMTGQAKRARSAFEQVSAGDRAYRGEASMHLARLAMARGEPDDALDWAVLAASSGSAHIREEALFLQAELARQAGRHDQAGRILGDMEGGYWAALGYLNLAADYAGIDGDPSRALIALRVAQAMASEDLDRDRMKDLSMRILVNAGVLSYRRGDHDKALDFLNKVSLDHYLAPQALYFHGLAHAAKDNYRAAMQSWHRARKFPLAFPGTTDAWLGMGRGYDEAGFLGQAGEAYLAAISAFEGEGVSLETLELKIKNRGAYDALVKAARRDDVEWFLADSRTLTQPRIAYLLHFMEQPEAQQAVKRVADLEKMEIALDGREQDLTVFLASLQGRARQAGDYTGPRPSELIMPEVESLAERWRTLSENATPGSPQARELAELKRILNDANRRSASFDRRLEAVPASLAQLSDRVTTAQEEVRQLKDRVRTLRSRAEQSLDEMALAFLGEERQRIARSLDRTQQQIAHLYEHLALTGLKREAADE